MRERIIGQPRTQLCNCSQAVGRYISYNVLDKLRTIIPNIKTIKLKKRK